VNKEAGVPSVIYDGNGADGGLVPVDSNPYNPGTTVNVAINDSTTAQHEQNDSNGNPENILTGTLTRTGATFLYWNTAANGSGQYFGPSAPSTFPFPNQAGNLTLFAQWAVSTGLTGGGATAHYQFQYDESLGGPGGIEPARTNAVIAVCEGDFNWLQTQFAGVDITKGITLPIPTFVTALGGGASWWPLKLKPGNGPASSLRPLMIAEVSEMFMLAQSKGWGFSSGVNDEESCGEGLSLFLTVQFQLTQGMTPLFNTGSCDSWLNSSLPASNPASTEFDGTTHYGARNDYVNSTLPFAGNGPGTGCSLLFIYYLFHQLGFSIPDIIAAAPGLDSNGNPIDGACLRGVYQNLTSDTTDPFPYFANLLAAGYPPNQVASIPGPNTDDPWPLGSLSFVGAKNTWGKDEVNDIIATGGIYPDGFYLALDGFSQNVVAGAQPSVPTIAFGGATTQVSATPPQVVHQSPNNPRIPQRIMFAYDVKFATPLGTFPTSGETPVAVNSSITVLSTPFPGTTEFFFLAGADPYFTNVVQDPSNPGQLNVPWLSEDLRVFTATPGAPPATQNQFPVPGGPQFVENSVGGAFDFNGAYTYIQALLQYLNQNYGNPGGIDPFDPNSNVIPQQATEFTADSSVTPFTLIGFKAYNNYSFAIARVRLKGSQGPSGAATGVKVFFRIWGTQTADTGWDPTETYLSQNDGSGNPLWPLAPADDHTIPFFATSPQPNFTDPSDPEFQTGGFTNTGANNLTITIEQGDSQWAYFGCYLNVNDPNVVVNGVEVPNAFPGTHHCLVAQIAYADAPIQTVGGSVPTPESGDQLAQRNLQVTTSDNPGPASTHRVPQTFDVKPSGAPPTSGPLAGQPDELMIEWGTIPVGSVARIYWPAVSSAEVIKLALWMYGVHPLKAVDAYTIEVRTIDGVTFVPIPQGTGASFAGLFTVELPQTVTTGQEFNIVVRRIGKRLREAVTNPPPPAPVPQVARAQRRVGGSIVLPDPGVASRGSRLAVVTTPGAAPVYERYIVGSFQIKIPVSTRAAMLPAEETTLAILKARLEAMPTSNRWYPVLLRYIGQIAGRVDGLGGNASSIPASLGGYRPGTTQCVDKLEEFTGKVREVVFDCFGEFNGFVLEDCCEQRAFESRAREIGELVLRALRERLTVTIFKAGEDHKIVRLVVKA
jgi:hypothetical protein